MPSDFSQRFSQTVELRGHMFDVNTAINCNPTPVIIAAIGN